MNCYALKLNMQLENAAFDDNRAAEAARILRRLADRLEGGAQESLNLKNRESADGWLFDRNGNSVGTWEAKARRVRN